MLSGEVRDRFDPILTIVSPPRCASTAVARSFWQHPRFRWYVHEPYDKLYHRGADHQSVEAALAEPLDAEETAGNPIRGRSKGIVIKEMTFQPGRLLPELLTAATLPVVVALRDPRLSVWSRMRRLKRDGLPPSFPPSEAGWDDLEKALAYAGRHQIPYVVVEVTRLRSHPARLLPPLCERLGMSFDPAMLSWPSLRDVSLGHLDADQRAWYERVLASTGFEPPTEPVPEIDDFPQEIRPHLREWMRIYSDVLTDQRLLG